MDRRAFSALAHREHTFCSPVSPERLERLLDLIPFAPGHRALDIGCGSGEIALRLAARGFVVDAVDVNPSMLGLARTRTVGRDLRGAVTWRHAAGSEVLRTTAPVQLVVCIGAHDPAGVGTSIDATLASLRAALVPDGHLLFGELYWRRPPSDAFLALLGATRESHAEFAAIVRAADAADFDCVHAECSSQDEWDAYQWQYVREARRAAQGHSEAEAILRLTRASLDVYLDGGREAFGFGFFTLRRRG